MEMSRGRSSQAIYFPRIEGPLVVLDDQLQIITDRITKGSTHLDTVSIVGVSGLGKTTIATKVYNDVSRQFQIRAWCPVSRKSDKRQLLVKILNHVVSLHDLSDRMTEEELGEHLHKGLKGKKYFIVFDDMWNAGVWNDLSNCFPDDHNGSRILLTTQLLDVALQAKPDCNPHFLRLFNDEESWKLLQKKIFQQESCPLDLVEVGKELVKTCKGLPLSIVVLGGLLATLERKLESWEQIKREILIQNVVRLP